MGTEAAETQQSSSMRERRRVKRQSQSQSQSQSQIQSQSQPFSDDTGACDLGARGSVGVGGRVGGRDRAGVVPVSVEYLRDPHCGASTNAQYVPVDVTLTYPACMVDRPISPPHALFLSLDDLFPGSHIGQIFDENSSFRTAIRDAARKDFSPRESSPASQQQREGLEAVEGAGVGAGAERQINDPRSSVMSSWRSQNPYSAMGAAFSAHGVALTGVQFVTTLTELCTGEHPLVRPLLRGQAQGVGAGLSSTDTAVLVGEAVEAAADLHVFGSWMDIVGVRGRGVAHSWHQDSGLHQITVMLGFPPEDGYRGRGVFSHVLPLSHRLTSHNSSGPRLWGDLSVDMGTSGPVSAAVAVPAESVLQPVYRRGGEVMVYSDNDVFHSAPDLAHRQSLWRFM